MSNVSSTLKPRSTPLHFKRIYVEITSSCNLKCSFCQETKRPVHFMSVKEFRHVIEEIGHYTSFIYLHVKGEPLLHPDIDKLLNICRDAGIQVNITTNGTLLMSRLPILLSHPAHQINISCHSAEDNDCIDMDTYFKDVFHACDVINHETSTEISLRLWTTKEDPYLFGEKNLKLRDRIHINVQEPFEWPDIENSYFCDRGLCQGLRSHIAILCDGTVVPCCLDGNGMINLGNIFTDSLDSILSCNRAVAFKNGYLKKTAVEPLCQHCSYKERFNSKL